MLHTDVQLRFEDVPAWPAFCPPSQQSLGWRVLKLAFFSIFPSIRQAFPFSRGTFVYESINMQTDINPANVKLLPYCVLKTSVPTSLKYFIFISGLTYSSLTLLSTVVFLLVATHLNGWKLDIK